MYDHYSFQEATAYQIELAKQLKFEQLDKIETIASQEPLQELLILASLFVMSFECLKDYVEDVYRQKSLGGSYHCTHS